MASPQPTAAEIFAVDQGLADSARQLEVLTGYYRERQAGAEDDLQTLANIGLGLEISLTKTDLAGLVLAAVRKIARTEDSSWEGS